MPDSLPTTRRLGPAASRARIRYHAALKLVRRVHLFAGLFMTPWVFLYGVTGFLFNHPEAFPDREVHTAGRAEVSGTALDGFPTAGELADRVVRAINDRTDGPPYRLVDRSRATYSRTLFVNASGRGREHLVRFDPDTAETFIRSSPLKVERPRGSLDLRLALADAPRDRLTRGVPALLARLGLDAETATVRNAPDLDCMVERHGRRWRVAYHLDTGVTTIRPRDDPAGTLSMRRFLTGLHLSFTYPSRVGTRWLWAVVVDAMFVAMVFWGVSGLLMWWQMKKLRWWGSLTLLASLVAAMALALGMHAVLSLHG